MHSWVFRQRDQLQRLYGFPAELLSEDGLDEDPPVGDPDVAEDATEDRPHRPVRRIAVTPMPRRVQ